MAVFEWKRWDLYPAIRRPFSLLFMVKSPKIGKKRQGPLTFKG